MEIKEVVKILVVVLVLLLMIGIAIVLFKGKGGDVLGAIKNALRFGRA